MFLGFIEATREQNAVGEAYALHYGTDIESWMYEGRKGGALMYLRCEDGTFVYDENGRPVQGDNPALPLSTLVTEEVLV